MKNFLLLVIGVTGLIGLFPTTSNSKEELRVVSWNLQWYPGGKPGASKQEKVRHAQLVAEQLAKLKPDILLVQEIRDWAALEELANTQPGLSPVVVSSLPGAQELGIASTLKPSSAWYERWETDGVDDPPRGFAFAALELPDGRLLAVYNVHLKSNRGKAASNRIKREEAMRQLVEHVSNIQEILGKGKIAGVIVGGDFNTTLDPDKRFDDEKTLPILVEAGLKWTGEGSALAERVSLPANSRYQAVAFDHIFVKGIHTSSAKTVDTGEASDHRAVIVDISLQEE